MRELNAQEVAQHVENIAADGFSIIHDSIDPAFIARLMNELERLESVRPGGHASAGKPNARC